MATEFLVGQVALSAFRVANLKKALTEAGLDGCEVSTRWVFPMLTEGTLSTESREKAKTLLDAGDDALPREGVFVAPRLGQGRPGRRRERHP